MVSTTSQASTLPDDQALDFILTVQLIVAWAGEAPPRLGWWRTLLTSDYGGLALLSDLAPRTAPWAALQAAREAARRIDAAARARASSPDELVSLYHLGPAVDERLTERLRLLKASGRAPHVALPGLARVLGTGDSWDAAWDADAFMSWAREQGRPDTTTEPVGRRLTGSIPPALDVAAARLAAALVPLAADYPLPFYRIAR